MGPKREKKGEKPQEREESDSDRTFVTPIDRMMETLEEKKTLPFSLLSKMLDASTDSVEKIGLVFEKHGIADVQYPTMITKNPVISLIKPMPAPKKEPAGGEKIAEYAFEVDAVPVIVVLTQKKGDQVPTYLLKKPVLGPYTRVFLDALKDDISEKVPVEISEIADTQKAMRLKERFFAVAVSELKKYLAIMPETELEIMAGMLLHDMYGLGDIELIMGDNRLEEIAINGSKAPVTVYHKKRGWLKTDVYLKSEDDIANYAAQVARKVGRDITTLNPILDAHLLTGDRVNATLTPITASGNTMTIRRFARRPWTVVDFIGKSHTMNLEMASLLWMAMHYEMNVLIAGGTASGKTSTLNVLSAFIPAYHRIISIEDVREIMLPDYMHWNWVPMTTRNPNPEGLGEVQMLDLMQSSLRMRPDRIIVGEMRRKREAEVLFEAMHTGHSVYSTMHANTANEVVRRLTEPPMSIPALQTEAIDLLLVQYRDRRRNVRRTYEISEIDTGVEDEQLSVNTIFKWDPRSDDWESINPANKFVRQLNLHTGMTEEEIQKELEGRASVLEWMKEHQFSEINDVGRVMKAFYANPDFVKKAAEKNESPRELQKG